MIFKGGFQSFSFSFISNRMNMFTGIMSRNVPAFVFCGSAGGQVFLIVASVLAEQTASDFLPQVSASPKAASRSALVKSIVPTLLVRVLLVPVQKPNF